MIKLPSYSQLDKRWDKQKLSPSALTIGSHGCVVTSIAMALGNYAYDWTPARLCEELVKEHGFTPEGYIIWDALVRATKGNVYFHNRIRTENNPGGMTMKIEVAIDKIRNLLDMGQPVCLHVDAQRGDGVPDHFIVAYDYVLDGKVVADLKVKDPWGGKDGLFSSMYGEIRDGIYGYVTLIGPPIRFPDQSKHVNAGKTLWMASQLVQGINIQTHARNIIDASI